MTNLLTDENLQRLALQGDPSSLLAAEILRLRAVIREHCKAYCEPWLPYRRHAPECLASEIEP